VFFPLQHRIVGFDDLSITLRTNNPDHVAGALCAIDPAAALPILPDDLRWALKFGLCLRQRRRLKLS